jgi:Fur family ferric uptake transcriptional regulator
VGRASAAEPTWSEAQIRSTLSASKLKATAPRVLLVEELSRRKVPATHAEIFESLESHGFDRVTLYRNLQTLSEAGLLLRIEGGDRIWRFELLGKHGQHGGNIHPEHAHFVCTECGAVACLPADAVTLRSAALRARAVEVQIRGQCQKCA